MCDSTVFCQKSRFYFSLAINPQICYTMDMAGNSAAVWQAPRPNTARGYILQLMAFRFIGCPSIKSKGDTQNEFKSKKRKI